MKVRAHVFVSGRVQGVFFRGETVNVAQHLGVDGWIKNLSDGRVEAVFEGERENVEQAVDFCKHGPPGAHVSNLDVKWERWTGELQGFGIIRWRL